MEVVSGTACFRREMVLASPLPPFPKTAPFPFFEIFIRVKDRKRGVMPSSGAIGINSTTNENNFRELFSVFTSKLHRHNARDSIHRG